MQVLVATDAIGSLSSLRAGRVLATGWPDGDVTVVPLGEAGAGFAQAAADQLGAEPVTGMLDEQVVTLARAPDTTLVALEPASGDTSSADLFGASSYTLGRAIREALESSERPRRLLIDLTGLAVHDGGAGLLSALGAEADVPLDAGALGLVGISRLDLLAAHARLAGIEIVGVVPSDQIAQPLLGLRGITSLRRSPNLDPGQLLETDATLAALAALAGPQHADRPGAGACGGLGLAVLALGGRLVTGPAYALEPIPVHRAVRSADLVVTGCTTFDFARRGGGVVAEVARVGEEHLAPCIAVAGEVLIGGRELRTLGIESAYAVREQQGRLPASGDVTEAELMATARRVGRSWRW